LQKNQIKAQHKKHEQFLKNQIEKRLGLKLGKLIYTRYKPIKPKVFCIRVIFEREAFLTL
jgi:hypothetical protein